MKKSKSEFQTLCPGLLVADITDCAISSRIGIFKLASEGSFLKIYKYCTVEHLWLIILYN